MLTITKLDNDNVEVTGREQAYTLLPSMHTFRDKSGIDGVKVMSDGFVKDVFSYTNVVEVIRKDGTIVPITDGDTLYNELKDNFFFISDVTFPTDGLQYSQLFNTPFSINSGNGYEFLSAVGDFLQLSSVITCTGDFDFEWPPVTTMADFTGTRFISLSIGVTNADFIAIRADNLFRVRINNTIIDKPYPFAANTTYSIRLTRVSGLISFIVNDVVIATETNTDTTQVDRVYSYISGTERDVTGYQFKLDCAGVVNTFDMFQVDGTTLYPREFATTGLTATINGAMPVLASNLGEQVYLWGYNYYTTGGVLDNTNGTVLITGDNANATVDINGNNIFRPAIPNFYNSPATQTTYAQIEELPGSVVDTSGDFSIAFWIEPVSGGIVYNNGPCYATYDEGTTTLTFTRDNVTLLTHVQDITTLTLVVITSNAAGNTNIYYGDVLNTPVNVVANSSAGSATGATVPMLQNNDASLVNGFDGYSQITWSGNKVLTVDEIDQIWQYWVNNYLVTFIDNQGNTMIDNSGNILIKIT